MALQSGTKLGFYEIRKLIGQGGMGEVYLAHDTKLKRDVALKMLPEQFARDPERLARFRREAQLLASLNQANIATIHGLEESGEEPCLVMEFVPGETLAERIDQSRESNGTGLPLEEVLDIAKQICEALEHAHEKGIIHRDLKPANVKLTPQGKVKVLDFGLAKAFASDGPSGRAAYPDSNSPTVVPGASPTLPGVILGTAAYMSPEQARGKIVDKRTDIWALGCVLYELLTAKPAFRGEDVTEIIAAVVKGEPDWSALPETTPPAIRSLLRRCLTKDAAHRSRDAAEIRFQIEEVRAASVPVSSATVVMQTPAPTPRRWLLLTATACLAAAVATLATWYLRAPAGGGQQVLRSVIPLPPNQALAQGSISMLALSPDGTHLAYVASSGGTQQLYLRALDALDARPIAGTEGALSPFFSPDGQWIGFFTANSLKKVSASGGSTLTLASLPNPRGGTWGPNGTIVFAPGNAGPLTQVSAAGGAPQPLTDLGTGEAGHRWPQFLPDGKAVLFTVATAGSQDDFNIAVQRLDSTESKILIRGGTYGRYVPTGHLVYYRGGTLMSVQFDPARLELQGTPSPVLEGVQSSLGNAGAGQFSFSNPGTLAYVAGGPQSSDLSLVIVDRQGKAQPLSAPPQNYDNVKLSPDGRRAALGLGGSIWIYDLARDTLTRLTFEGQSIGPLWTPDSKRVAYRSAREGKPTNIFWKPADGSGPEERLTTSEYGNLAASFTPDGKTLVFAETRPETGSDIWVLPLEEERKPRLWLQTPYNEATARISPDGHWLAYTSDESGRNEIYVRPFPGPGPQYQISTEGGQELAWSPKGNELFYRVGAQREKMMVVDIETQTTFSAGKPRVLFEAAYYTGGVTGAEYSVFPDAQHFLMMKAKAEQAAALTQINVVQNWFEELKQKVPVK